MKKDKNWNLYEQHYHRHDDCYLISYPNGSPVMMHPEHYKGVDIGLLYKNLLEQITDTKAQKTIKKLFGFE